MKQNALQGVVPAETEDLNVEHLQLLLLIFHNFSEKGRRDILTLFVQITQELSASMDAQMRSVPLILARLHLRALLSLPPSSFPSRCLFSEPQNPSQASDIYSSELATFPFLLPRAKVVEKVSPSILPALLEAKLAYVSPAPIV